MTIGYYDATNNKWYKFMQYSVMPGEHNEFLKANLPDPAAICVNVPAGHDAIWHPSDWTYADGVLSGPDNQTTTTTVVDLSQ